MASPAAVLEVLVQADTVRAARTLNTFEAALKRLDKTTPEVDLRTDTRAATTSLKKYDSALDRVDKRSVSATTRTSTLGKATRSTGSRLASAARYAAGAAAAYLSIAQAKAAITTTQDLAKTTAGLNRNLGFTVKEGSRWASVAKSRDVDAKALTMSFTTLSRRVVEAGHAIREGGGSAETAMVPFTRLGLSQEDVLKGSKDLDAFLPKLADSFGDAEGGAKRQASAQQLLGRGYATILPLFADGAKGLQEQQKWADKYGTTLNEKTLKAQMDLVSAQRESKVAWLGIQMAFAQGLTPALEKANDVFQRIAAIMANDKLTDAEKWKKVGDIIGKWADKALDAFVKILPSLVEKAGEAAPKIAKALWEGFKDAPIWGQVAIGLWFLGGTSAIKALAGKLLVTLGGYLGGAFAATAIGQGLGAAAPALAAIAGPVIGSALVLAIGAYVGAKLSDEILANTDSIAPMNMKDIISPETFKGFKGDELKTVFAGAIEGGQDLSKSLIRGWVKAGDVGVDEGRRWMRILDEMQGEARRTQRIFAQGEGFGLAEKMAKDGKLLKGEINRAMSALDVMPKGMRAKAMKAMLELTSTLEQQGKLPEGATRKLVNHMEDEFGKLPKGVDRETKEALRAADKNLGDAEKKGSKHGRDLNKNWTGSVTALAHTTTDAMRNVGENVNAAGKALGVAKPVKFTFKEMGQSEAVGGAGRQAGGSVLPRAAQGMTVPGAGSGDKVHLQAMVEPGEGVFVMNRNAMGAMQAMNDRFPRFQQGGGLDFALGPYTVPPITYDAAHAGGNSHVHISGTTIPWVVAIGHQLQQMGNLVGEHPAFGGVAPGVHANYPTGHYTGHAIDVYAGDGVENQGWVASIARILGGAGVAAVEEIKRQVLKGPAGALKDIGQKGIDRVTSMANKWIGEQAPAETGGVSLVGGSAGANQQLGHQMLTQTPGRRGPMRWGPWGESEWPPYNALIISESNWDTHATNPSSGAYGIPQSLPASKMAAAGADWRDNAATQIAWGLDYIKEVYGSPSATPLGGYRRGGILGMAEGGPVWPDKLLGPQLGDVLQRVGVDTEGGSEALQGLMKRIHGAQPNSIREGELLGKLLDLRKAADSDLVNAGIAFNNNQDIPWDLEFNAGKWNIMNEKGKAIESFSSEAEAVAKYTEMIEPLLGLFHGHTEQFWRSSELDNLWSLRKRLILAAKQMKERREQMHDALQVANEKRRDWQHRVNEIDKKGHTPGDLRPPDPNKDIQEWNQQSDKDRQAKGRAFQKEGGKLAGDRAWASDGSWRLVAVGAGAKRVLSALEEKIIPALETGETRFNDARVSLLNDHLATVQGAGMSMRGLDQRPPVDELVQQFAGEINDAAFRLKEMRANPKFTDTTEEIEAPTWSIGQLVEFAQALRYGAFTSLGFAGEFAGGGLIPSGQFGLVGEKGPEFISGPTQVTPTGPMPTPMIFADVYIGGERIDERVRAEITGQKNSDNLRLRARHVQR